MMMAVSLTFFGVIRHHSAAFLRATAPAAPLTVYESIATPHRKLLAFPHARQAYRITHWSCERLGGPVKTSYSYGITSLAATAATPQQLLQLQRRHWQVESANHYRRDTTFREDSSRVRTGHGPANAAALNNLALALLLPQRQFTTVPEAQIYYAGNAAEAVQLLLEPG